MICFLCLLLIADEPMQRRRTRWTITPKFYRRRLIVRFVRSTHPDGDGAAGRQRPCLEAHLRPSVLNIQKLYERSRRRDLHGPQLAQVSL